MDRVDGSRVKKTRSTVIAGALVTALAGGAAVVSGGAAGAAPGTSSEVGAYGSQTVGLSAQMVAISLKKGVSSTAVFYTAPGAHVAFAVNIPGSDTSITGSAKADAKGKVTISFMVPPPATPDTKVKGTIQIHVTDPGKQGTATISFQALPLVQFSTSTRVKTDNKGTTLTVKVQLAQAAQVAISVSMHGAKKPAASKQDLSGDAKHPVSFDAALGTIKGHPSLDVSVKVTASDGTSDTLTLPVAL